jgi:CDP-diacylglycerol--glycerol-3-phosphate 3-phosphatidyltransferase|uniref:CDP-diacylglycerol--glycerol-3-phosphate 3-phosphatidyltransferase n=1 Tax=Chlorobium chlorochromatii (strain CaD3) TaxID=340177 RepID=Q3AU84_CHLCH
MEGRIINLPNALSFLRILLIPWFLYAYHHGHLTTAIVVMIVAILSDWFDGRVARWTGDVSDMGKILDPLADKLCLASVAIYFLWVGELPLWFVLFALLRDVVIFLGAGYVKLRHAVVTTSMWPGKWAVGFVSMMFIVMVWPHPIFKAYPLKEIFLYLSTLTLLYSFVLYTIRFYRIHKGLDFKA